MFRSATLALLLILTLPAFAKDKDKDEGKDGPEERPVIEMTGFASFDEVFTKVAAIDEQLSTARKMLTTANNDLNTALELEKGTPLKDGLADLRSKADGKLAVAMEGTVPKLSATDAVPANVQAAIDAVNGMVAGITGSIEALTAIPAEAAALATETAAFPARIKEEATAAGLKPTEIPGKLAIVKKDVEITAGLPEKATQIVERMTTLVTTVSALAPVP
jgi:hypothetical protein